MLILSRRLGEKIILRCPDGTQITVVLVDVERGKARLGFDAPMDVVIKREELLALKEEPKP